MYPSLWLGFNLGDDLFGPINTKLHRLDELLDSTDAFEVVYLAHNYNLDTLVDVHERLEGLTVDQEGVSKAALGVLDGFRDLL